MRADLFVQRGSVRAALLAVPVPVPVLALVHVLVLASPGCGGSSHSGTGPSVAVTPAMGHPHVGQVAPDLELPDQEGQQVTLSSFRGVFVVLSFATSWCPYSQAEQPSLAQIAREYPPEDVRVVIVNVDETEEGYRRYLARMPMSMPVLRDARAARGRTFIPSRAPSRFRPGDEWKAIVTANLLLDREGRIRFFTLLDTLRFDAELVQLRGTLDRLLDDRSTP